MKRALRIVSNLVKMMTPRDIIKVALFRNKTIDWKMAPRINVMEPRNSISVTNSRSGKDS
ncbi:hypothetical protein [Owenweeksia hongkongensis]|uniref:hypothetical protein n=1 Tax=Owenweeksia hongkongensis TaxID=253245 RepID=UPI003A91969F